MPDDLCSWLEARKRAAEVPHRYGLTLAEAEAVRQRELEYIGVIEGLADELRHAVARQVRDGRCVECGHINGHALGCWVGEAEKALRAPGGGES